MDFFLTMPGIVKILGTLVLLLILNGWLKNLIVSVTAGTVVFALWSGHSPESAFAVVQGRLFTLNTFVLALIILQVIWLSRQMKETGVMADLVGSVRSRLSQRTSMAVLPAVIGLLPMPGGALFSAPLVDDLDQGKRVPDLLKTKTNYWFRHVWEYWWPLYPGVLLAIDISRLPIWQFLLLQLPLSLLAIGAGYLFLLRRIEEPEGTVGMPDAGSGAGRFFSLVLPIIVVIGIYGVVRAGLPGVYSVSKYLPMLLGITAALLVLQLQRPLPFSRWKGIVFSLSSVKMTAVIAAILVYGAFIEAKLPDGALFMESVRRDLTGSGIPLFVIVMALPFISGLATGLALGFVGASFPIVMNLIGPDPSTGTVLAYTVLAFGSGYMGMMLSPVHVCLVVSNEFFKTSILHSLYRLIPPALMVMAGTVALHFLVRLLFGV